MASSISERARGLLLDRNFGFLAPLGRNGWPHTTPVWVDLAEDGAVLPIRGWAASRRGTPGGIL